MKFFLKLQEHFLAVVPDRCESLFYDRGKNLLLFCGGAFAAAAEYIFDKLRTGILRIFNIVDQGMDIAASVGKGGENKPGVGSADHPVPDTGADPVFLFTVAESRLGERDGADGAEQVIEDLFGLVQLHSVVCSGDDIIGILKQQDQVIAGMIVMFDDQVIEPLQQLLVFQPAFLEPHQKLLSAAGLLLLRREFQLQQVVADIAGETFSGEVKVFVKFLVIQIQKSFREGQHFVFTAVHIAAAQLRNGTVGFIQSFFEFQYVFFRHSDPSFFEDYRSFCCFSQVRRAHLLRDPLEHDSSFSILTYFVGKK